MDNIFLYLIFIYLYFPQINMEKLASSLPLHLIATLLSPEREMQMGHVLRGVRLLHTLSDLASRHARLEQVLYLHIHNKTMEDRK